jgi:hypothetical protein
MKENSSTPILYNLKNLVGLKFIFLFFSYLGL